LRSDGTDFCSLHGIVLVCNTVIYPIAISTLDLILITSSMAELMPTGDYPIVHQTTGPLTKRTHVKPVRSYEK
jgi:hypothetical protein